MVITEDETTPTPMSEESDETEPVEQEVSDEEDDLPESMRPPPLISIPISQENKSDDDDDDEDWEPSVSKFANLKRGSVFVPHGQLDDCDENDGEGPSVEYIP